MGAAHVVFKSGKTMVCMREGGDDVEVAHAVLSEVGSKKGKKPENAIVRCDNGGGFDANEVVAVTVGTAEKAEGGGEEEEAFEEFGL